MRLRARFRSFIFWNYSSQLLAKLLATQFQKISINFFNQLMSDVFSRFFYDIENRIFHAHHCSLEKSRVGQMMESQSENFFSLKITKWFSGRWLLICLIGSNVGDLFSSRGHFGRFWIFWSFLIFALNRLVFVNI